MSDTTSGLDLTEAVAAGTEVVRDLTGRRPYGKITRAVIEAALPLIEAQVRAQIAADIEAYAEHVKSSSGRYPNTGRDLALREAVAMIRGERGAP